MSASRTTVHWRGPTELCGGQAVAIDEDGDPCCAFRDPRDGKWYYCTNSVDPDLEFKPKAWTAVFDMRLPK